MLRSERSLRWAASALALGVIALGVALPGDAVPGAALAQEEAPPPSSAPVSWVIINRTNTNLLVSIIRAEKTRCSSSGILRAVPTDLSIDVRAGESAGRSFLPDQLGVPFHLAVSPADEEGRVFIWCYRTIVRGRGDWMEVTRGEDQRLYIEFNPELKPPAPPLPQAAAPRHGA